MYHSAVAKSPGVLVREFCKKHHICTHCFHRPALRDVTRCEHCKNRDRVAQRKRLRRKYQREKADGVCVRCHKKRAQATNVRCVQCQAYHSAHKKKKRADLKRESSLLRWQSRKEPIDPGSAPRKVNERLITSVATRRFLMAHGAAESLRGAGRISALQRRSALLPKRT